MTLRAARPVRFMLEQLTVLGLDPLAFLDVAAQAGYHGIGLHMEGLAVPWSAQYSLIDDAPLRRAFLDRMRDHGLSLHVAEPFLIMPEVSRETLLRNLDCAAQLGAAVAGVLSFDEDPARSGDRLARLNGDAAERGLALTIEPYALSSLPSLSSALDAARAAGTPAGVTLDVLHVVRGGEHWSTMAGLDPALVRCIQISDGPRAAPADRGAEAVAERGIPGEGEFDLASLWPLLPPAVPIGIEVPSRRALETMGALAWARLLRERTAALLPG